MSQWTVQFKAKYGWITYRYYSDYYSALRWAEYHREVRGWTVLSITCARR